MKSNWKIIVFGIVLPLIFGWLLADCVRDANTAEWANIGQEKRLIMRYVVLYEPSDSDGIKKQAVHELADQVVKDFDYYAKHGVAMAITGKQAQDGAKFELWQINCGKVILPPIKP